MAIRFPIQPRMVPPVKIARRLGITLAEFEAKRAALEAAGFPKPDAILGNYVLDVVDRWIDARAGLTSPPGGLITDPAVIAERIRNRAWNNKPQ